MPKPGLPSREDLMAFIATRGGKTDKREIARAFHVKGDERIALKRMLEELEDEGVVNRRGKTLGRVGHLPDVTLADVTGRDSDGELIAEPADWDEDESGTIPKILVVTSASGRKPGVAPGVGDRVLIRVERIEDARPGEPAYQGRVIKLLSKPSARIIGVFRALPDGSGRLVPVVKREVGRELVIAQENTEGAKDGDLVAADILKQTRHYGAPTARVRERLGSLKSEKAVSLIAIHSHAIPHVFSRDAEAEAEAAKPATMRSREDWRDLPLVTIDPVDAKDHDDAVHAEPDRDPANPGGHVVVVAIADVSSYVQPGSALDATALDRGNSVYFPDRVVPMLPERISNDLCSLRELENRPALAVRMIFDAHGNKRRHTFHRVMMRSAAKLSYQQAQSAVDGAADDKTGPLLDPVLKPLWAAYAALKAARDDRGPLDLDLPERKLVLKADGSVDRVVIPPRLDAHRLIEEFMIQANVAAAETLESKRTPLVYRVHDAPSVEKLEALRELLKTLDIELAKGNLRPAHFNRILERVDGSEQANLVNEVVLRTQAQAEYAAENYGHFGLNLRRYAHFTSPIRRYADLIVHRALIRALDLGRDGLPEDVTVQQLNEVGARISAAERRAMAAERETIDRLIAHHLADRVGASFTGRIAGVTRSGLFVKLDETGADGFVPASTLGADYFAHDEAARALVGAATGESYRLGDHVEVKLVEAAPVAGALRFEMLSEGRQGKPAGRGKRGMKRAVGARSGPRTSKAKSKAKPKTKSGKGRR